MFNYYIMSVKLEVKDYDSDDDISSTEDESIEFPVINKRNKKLKKKKIKEKKSMLKESKIVKDSAKLKIKHMENEINDLDFFGYLKEKNEKTLVSLNEHPEQPEIHGFFTDNELKDQINELNKLEKYQKVQWKSQKFSHTIQVMNSATTQNNIQGQMTGIFGQRIRNNSRTKTLNSRARVDTRLALPQKKKQKNYSNIGSMW